MEDSESTKAMISSLEELGQTLSNLRSALGELLFSISDWHFVTDVKKRKQVEYIMRACLAKIATIGQDQDQDQDQVQDQDQDQDQDQEQCMLMTNAKN